MRTTLILIATILTLYSRPNLADVSNTDISALMPVLVLDFEILGDSSIESLRKNDAFLIDKHSKMLRNLLRENQLFEVVDDEQTMSDMQQASLQQYLHRCNGCELKLAAEHGATHVLVPWIQRMSALIQMMNVELRNVKTGEVNLRKAYNFRGNNEKAWKTAIEFFIEDVQKIIAAENKK
ncbi:MAG: DUF2380 domain-containing protein [Granulosicoccus sp.]